MRRLTAAVLFLASIALAVLVLRAWRRERCEPLSVTMYPLHVETYVTGMRRCDGPIDEGWYGDAPLPRMPLSIEPVDVVVEVGGDGRTGDTSVA
jgi:hypothetical protein